MKEVIEMIEFFEMNIEYESYLLDKMDFSREFWTEKYFKKQKQLVDLVDRLNKIKNSVHSLAS